MAAGHFFFCHFGVNEMQIFSGVEEITPEDDFLNR